MANASIMARSLIIESQRNKRFQESLDESALVDGIATPLSAEQ